MQEKKIEIKMTILNLMFSSITLPKLKILAPVKAGIDKMNAIFAESILEKFNNLPAVITIPDRLTPGIRATA